MLQEGGDSPCPDGGVNVDSVCTRCGAALTQTSRTVQFDPSAQPELLHCYCTALGAGAVSVDACYDWLQKKTAAYISALLWQRLYTVSPHVLCALCLHVGMYIGSSAVLIVNIVLNIVLKKLTTFECHHSIDTLVESLSKRTPASGGYVPC